MTGGELSARTEAEKYREWAHRDLVAAGIIQSLLDALDAAEARVAAVEAERDELVALRRAGAETLVTLRQQRAAQWSRAEKAEALVEAGLAAVGHECLDFSRGCASVYPDQADRWCHVCSVRALLGGTA